MYYENDPSIRISWLNRVEYVVLISIMGVFVGCVLLMACLARIDHFIYNALARPIAFGHWTRLVCIGFVVVLLCLLTTNMSSPLYWIVIGSITVAGLLLIALEIFWN